MSNERNELLKIAEGVDEHPLQVDLNVKHHFAHGTYGRELFIPAGCRLLGKIHRYSTINVVLQGEIYVETNKAKPTRFVQGDVIISPPGTRRFGRAITNTRWLTLHATEQTDPALVEDEVVATDFIELAKPPAEYPPAGLTPVEQDVLNSLLLKQQTALHCIGVDTEELDQAIKLVQGTGYTLTSRE